MKLLQRALNAVGKSIAQRLFGVVSVYVFITDFSIFMDYGMTFTDHYYGKTDYSYMVVGIDSKQAQTIEKMPEIENYLTVGSQYGYVSADVHVNECGKLPL